MKRIHFDVETEGFCGASTTGTLALTAAAYFPDITLTIAMAPSDFIWQGFMQGEKDGCKEWIIEGESLFLTGASPCPICPLCTSILSIGKWFRRNRNALGTC